MKISCCIGLLLLSYAGFAQTDNRPYSQRMADSFMARYPDSILIGSNKAARWDYEQGLVLKAIGRVWARTGDGRYFTYIQKDIDQFVGEDGSIRTYKPDEFNIDNVTTGRVLLTLSQQTLPGREKYQKAAALLRKQLADQPRTKEGGFWHKNRYPNQMWLDGLYMAEPFYAEYAQVFNEPQDFDDIARQFALIEAHLIDPKTGLLYHGYDESRQQKWADPKTGQSPNFWGRAIGWYAMALVDVLDYFPASHPKRAKLVGYLQRLAPVVARYQNPKTGCWFQIIDQGTRKGNYPEASATCMYVYALAKGARLGYLSPTFAAVAQRGYQGILKTFIEEEADGKLTLNGTVSVGGLGGNPYRDGSYDYYLSEPIRKNDLKGVGPFIMASVEMEIARETGIGAGKTVGLDYYFNHEFRKGLLGQQEPFHYTWEDRMHSGFWLWGNTFRELGAATRSVPVAPTKASLQGLDVYIIVDPDTPKETAAPNYIQDADTKAISDWVWAGGVLVLMANDSANCELKHFNDLAKAFGIQFLNTSLNMVQGTNWEQGRLDIPQDQPIFKQTRTVYIKELSPLSLTPPAVPVLMQGRNTILAVSTVGKGTVFAVGDPWLYNEYTDGRRIPATYQNFLAGKEVATWLLKQAGNRP